jgi:YlmC/YmxH family sporulation protein
MEESMYSIGNLRSMEVIDIQSGTKLGYIRDIKIDCDNYNIISLLLPSTKSAWFGKSDTVEIKWAKVRKIGIDVILIDGSDLIDSDRG